MFDFHPRALFFEIVLIKYIYKVIKFLNYLLTFLTSKKKNK